MRGSRIMFEHDFLDSKLLADDKSVGHLALAAHTPGAAPRYPTHICPLTSQHFFLPNQIRSNYQDQSRSNLAMVRQIK